MQQQKQLSSGEHEIEWGGDGGVVVLQRVHGYMLSLVGWVRGGLGTREVLGEEKRRGKRTVFKCE